MIRIVVVIVLVLGSVNVYAAWTGSKEIGVLKVQDNGVYLKLKDFSNTEEAIDCQGPNTFFMTQGEANYSTKASFLLASYMSGRPVNISYYMCAENASNQLDLGSVSFE